MPFTMEILCILYIKLYIPVTILNYTDRILKLLIHIHFCEKYCSPACHPSSCQIPTLEVNTFHFYSFFSWHFSVFSKEFACVILSSFFFLSRCQLHPLIVEVKAGSLKMRTDLLLQSYSGPCRALVWTSMAAPRKFSSLPGTLSGAGAAQPHSCPHLPFSRQSCRFAVCPRSLGVCISVIVLIPSIQQPFLFHYAKQLNLIFFSLELIIFLCLLDCLLLHTSPVHPVVFLQERGSPFRMFKHWIHTLFPSWNPCHLLLS